MPFILKNHKYKQNIELTYLYVDNKVLTHFAESFKRNDSVLNMLFFVDTSKKGNNWIISFPLTYIFTQSLGFIIYILSKCRLSSLHIATLKLTAPRLIGAYIKGQFFSGSS